MNWHRGLWRLALGLLGLFWLVVLGAFATGDLPGHTFGEALMRLFGITAVYLTGCKLIEWVVLGFTRRR